MEVISGVVWAGMGWYGLVWYDACHDMRWFFGRQEGDSREHM